MKRILFSQTFFETDTGGNSRPRFEAGKHYPTDDVEAQRCIARGIAKEIEVADEPPAAEVAATEEAAAPAAEGAEAPAAPPAPTGKAKK